MAEFKFSCPHCGQHIQCDERLSRKQVQCPACQVLIVVPLSPTMAAEEASSIQSGRTWETFPPVVGKIISSQTGLPKQP
jgi:hypothetical protein